MKHLREIFKFWQDSRWPETNFSLRNHTCFSDWKKSVKELYRWAVANIVTHLSITDKSSIEAYSKGNAMNIWKWFWLKIIPWVESLVKINHKTISEVNMLLYFPEKLLKDPNFIKNIRDAIEIWGENWWTDLSDILYLKNRYDLANVIANPFDQKKLNKQEMDAFLKTLVNKWEIDWFLSDQNANSILPNWYEVPLFIWNNKKEEENPFWVTSSIENRDFEILSRKWNLWIYIWRLNPPHIWHIRIIKKALRENWKLMIFLWSANKVCEKNPFSASERLFFLNFYFKQEIANWTLIISTLDDVWDFEKWTSNLWIKIWKEYPDFKWKVNIYWGNLEEDKAIAAINEFEEKLELENVEYREIEREDFFLTHNWKKVEISGTSVRKSLEDWNFELAKKLMSQEIWDLVIHKRKEKNKLLESEKLFFVYPPKLDKKWKLHRNYKKGMVIKKQVESDFDKKNIASDISDATKIVVVWWDWSILRAIKKYGHLWIPFYPIAAWSANFIPSNFTHPYQILTEENETIEFPLLDVKYYDDKWNIVADELAVNDTYLNADRWSMWILTVEWSIDYPNRVVKGDWLILSTPIWSTAYTKNAGWSALPLNENDFAITDIVSSRWISHTVDANQEFTIEVIRWNFVAHADGTKVENFSTIKVSKSKKTIKIILPLDKDFRRNRYKED